jgi:hypothetical protein
MRASVLIGAAIVGCGALLYAGAGSYLDDQGPDLRSVEEALQMLSKGDRAGFDVLAKRFPFKNATPKQLDTHARLIRGHVESLGEPCGFELVGAQGVGSSMRGYTYLCKYEDGRMRWRFNFYRPKDEWKLEGVSFDSDDNALYFASGYKLPLLGEPEVAERPQGHCN